MENGKHKEKCENKKQNTNVKRTSRMEKKGKRVTKKDDKNQNPKKKLTIKQKIIIAVSIIVAILALIGIVFGVYVFKAKGDIKEAVLNVASDILGTDEPIFVLILGMSEDISAKLTDTIILAGYNPESQKAFMLSIPRDTYVGSNPNYASGYDKINAVYQKDISKTVEAVEKLTGVNIDNYVLVRNTALPAIVEAIGEVEFDVPIDMDYDDPTQDLHIHLKSGIQMIDKDEAEQLLRFRHNNDGSSYPIEYGDNDYGRMRTQREFIRAVASQLIASGNTDNLKDIATAVFNNVETDLSLTKLISYIPSALKYDVDTLQMEQLPGSSDKLNNLYFYIASSSKTKRTMSELITLLELDEKETKKYYNDTVIKNITSTPKTTQKTQNNTASEITATEQTSQDQNQSSHTCIFSEWEIEKAATCTTAGTRIYTCECGKTQKEVINSFGHSMSGNICTICGYKENVKEPENNTKSHTTCTWDAGTVIAPATCKSTGTKTYKCTFSGCTKTKTETIAKTSHNMSNGKCTLCGYTESVKESENNKPSHTTCTWDTGTVTTPATCTSTGIKTYKCTFSGCAKTKTETIAKTSHNMSNGKCTLCGYTESVKEPENNKPSHTTCTWDAGTVTTPATCTSTGIKTLTCTFAGCGKTTTETILATGHNMSGGICSVCGFTEAPEIPPAVPPVEDSPVIE